MNSPKAIIILILLSIFTSSYSQNYVSFKENGLLSCCNPFPALLNCPADSIKAKQILDKAIGLNLPKKHINGYCEARADFVCRKISKILYSKDCEVGKIWVFSPSITSFVSKKTLSSTNPLIPEETINWEYHVAPVFTIQNKTKIDTVVIDFSIADNKLLNYKVWLNALNCKEAIYTFTDDSYYLFNTLDGLKLNGATFNDLQLPKNFPKTITGHFYYLNKENENWISSGLAYNEMAIYLIEKYYNDPKYLEYKSDLKNAIILNNLKRIILGESLNLPQLITEDVRTYFKNRNKYWVKEMK